MISFLQGNLNVSRVADDLLTQLVLEHRVGVAIISEPYRVRPTWLVDASGSAAIWIVDHNIRVNSRGAGDGYVWVRTEQATVVSCYLSPNDTIAVFRGKLEALEDDLRDIPGRLVVAGDLNARAIEWGMPQTNTRGKLVLEMAARLGLVVLNVGNTPTYRRPGFGYSIPDVTLVSEELVRVAVDWRVMSDFTGSDHNYIAFQLIDEARQQNTASARRPSGWNTAKMDGEKLVATLLEGARHVSPAPELTRDAVDGLVDATMRLVHRACDASMPRKRPWRGRAQAYWWNDQIAELRRLCKYQRRLAQRAIGRAEAMEKAAAFKATKKALGRAIRASKESCWKQLCDEVNQDPWGRGYKLVMGKLRPPPQVMDERKASDIVDALFPVHPVRADTRPNAGSGDGIPMFTADELMSAARSMKSGKAPGPDGIPAEALKAVASNCPGLLLDMYNGCLRAGVFPRRWKMARLALIPKGKGDPESPSSYRPLCMLDTAGKMMERLLKPRLAAAIERAGGLSRRQHGFRKGHSTIDAIGEVIGAVRQADTACHQARPIVLLVTLDVRNAFNSARWSDMLHALERSFSVPPYLSVVLRDYLKDRWLSYETAQGRRVRPVTAGAAQGSVLGPDLWNVTYDSLLRLEMPDDAFLVAFADDVAAVITARSPELAQLRLNQVMRRVDRWMEDHGLQLALAKTEIVILTRKRIPTSITMMVGAEAVETRSSARYLGVRLDNRLTFWDHIRGVCDKAAENTAAISRLMANVGGPKPCKRRLLLASVQSAMLYGAEIWADAMSVKKYRTRMSAVQRRGALRIACAYRTVSADAVLVVAGVIPIDLLAQERKEIYLHSSDLGRAVAAEQARVRTIGTWRRRWEESPNGRWTRLVIHDLGAWFERRHGEVNFYLTQFLTGHGYFRRYLFRMGKVGSPHCLYCGDAEDDVLHTFFACERFAGEREGVEHLLGQSIAPATIVGAMLASPEGWSAVAQYAERVLRHKREEGCLGNLVRPPQTP